jgi:hypothetical protein
MENVVIFYDQLEYITAIWYNLWPFGIHSVWSFGIFFYVLVCLEQEKSGNPDWRLMEKFRTMICRASKYFIRLIGKKVVK